MFPPPPPEEGNPAEQPVAYPHRMAAYHDRERAGEPALQADGPQLRSADQHLRPAPSNGWEDAAGTLLRLHRRPEDREDAPETGSAPREGMRRDVRLDEAGH